MEVDIECCLDYSLVKTEPYVIKNRDASFIKAGIDEKRIMFVSDWRRIGATCFGSGANYEKPKRSV